MEVALLENSRNNMQRSRRPPLHLDISRESGTASNDHATPSNRSAYGNEIDKGNLSPRVMRSACDFCHTKRIKCKRDDSDSPGAPCEQCKRRGNECKFSFKEKTGPKPKVLHAPKDGTRFTRHASASPSNFRQNSTRSNRSTSSASNDSRNRTQFSNSRNNMSSPQTKSERRPAIAESAALIPQIELERCFLHTYLGTVAQTLPFCEDRVLLEAMTERESAPTPDAVKSSVSQAQLAAALAIGALIHSNDKAESYHSSAREHLKKLFSQPDPKAASVLCMLAFYWQYRGDDERKLVYVRHAKLGLEQPPVAPSLELHICMEYLDFDNAEHPRNDAHSLPPILRVLHVVSCMLGNIQILMDPAVGSAPGMVYCRELKDCSLALWPNRGEDVPAILCLSLHAFLLVMLGRQAEAIAAILRIPPFLESCPNAPRALPLAWDTCLIAGSLAFLLQLTAAYESIHRAVSNSQNATAATKWTCRLPDPGASPSCFLNHKCRSTSNICSIIVQLWRQTNHGTCCFYVNSPESILSQINPTTKSSSTQRKSNPSVELRPQLDHVISSPHANYSRPPRPHRDVTGGASDFEDLSPDMRSTHLLNSNQASPIPFTPKRLRNSRANSPSGSQSPAARQPWNEAEDIIVNIKEEATISASQPSSVPMSSAYATIPRIPSGNRKQSRASDDQVDSSPALISVSSWPAGELDAKFSHSYQNASGQVLNRPISVETASTLNPSLNIGSFDSNGFVSAPNSLDYILDPNGADFLKSQKNRMLHGGGSYTECLQDNGLALLGDQISNGLMAGLGLGDDDPVLSCRSNSIGVDNMLAQMSEAEILRVLQEFGTEADNLTSNLPEFSSESSDTRAVR